MSNRTRALVPLERCVMYANPMPCWGAMYVLDEDHEGTPRYACSGHFDACFEGGEYSPQIPEDAP